MKSFRSILFLLLLAFVTLSCSKDDSNIDPHLQDFTCTVDYVELKDDSSAKIKFDISFNGKEESFFVNEIHGTGTVVLEPTFGHFLLHEMVDGNDGLICDKGMFYAGAGDLDISAKMQKNVQL